MDDLRLSEFKPRAKLVTHQTEVLKPRFPVIDAHNHLGVEFGGGWDKRPVEELLGVLDAAEVQFLVDLDGGWGEHLLNSHLELFKGKAPDRFQVFGGVNWSGWEQEKNRFGEWAAKRLEIQVGRGAQGLKIWKPLGLKVRDELGKLVPIDDPRLDPVWGKAAELDIPVLIHVADPVAFFDPIDVYNERYEELQRHPDWSFYGDEYPTFQELMDQFERLVARHPGTRFIGAHVGCYAENLEWVGGMLAKYPNYWIDISARLGELGRQPYSARKFFIDYQDRILFGTDFAPNIDQYRIFYRFLETEDEYFNYDPGEIPGQGRWQIYGLSLPDEVLAKIYLLNASKVLRQNTNE